MTEANKCCMCHEPRPAMRFVEGFWWCVACHDQFTADMNDDHNEYDDDTCQRCGDEGFIFAVLWRKCHKRGRGSALTCRERWVT
jgi:hypothetical protein